ncbi:flagellar protein FlbD [Aneurinibacillus soli]|uniref:Flagellar protein FlbD n=1 Tax=Aneurinibacillus soli TaxID=1500254 RepID=A0A0U5B9S1_9BACL|nr:flagellar FlbD family protein [Aneurinibacillus soli]PYE63392.1 flagellar protein FlbD [Aneurinibacillus soli]BAU27676.1 Flagellar protein FlbD [Aneurinibacillus soli]
MIRLTRLNGKEYIVNGLLIESVEATPDTMITLVNGKKFVIRESIPEVLSALTNFYREINVIKTMQLQKRDRKAEGLEDA